MLGYIARKRDSIWVGRRGEWFVTGRFVCVVLLNSNDFIVEVPPFRRVETELDAMIRKTTFV